MTLQNPVWPDGTYDERVPDFQGKMVFEHNDEIVDALRESDGCFAPRSTSTPTRIAGAAERR